MGNSNRNKRICLIPNVSGVGGMVSFRQKLVKGLADRGIGATYNLADTPYASVLVIGGTRDLAGLWRAKRDGVQVVQRLDGMNWIQRRKRTGWGHFLRAEYGNFNLSLIRSRIANSIIYQSEFSRSWWERVYGATSKPWSVVHNGVDLAIYTPNGPGKIPEDHVRLLLVEGNIGGGYEWGLNTAIQLGELLQSSYSHTVEVMVAGRIPRALEEESERKTGIAVTFIGQVDAERIPEIDRSAHILYAADLNPACPNSVIEALACGLPVVAFDTGALSEIVTEGSGELVPYGEDPWKLEPPNIEGLAAAAHNVLSNLDAYRKAARARAEKAFGLDRMVEGYLNVMNV